MRANEKTPKQTIKSRLAPTLKNEYLPYILYHTSRKNAIAFQKFFIKIEEKIKEMTEYRMGNPSKFNYQSFFLAIKTTAREIATMIAIEPATAEPHPP